MLATSVTTASRGQRRPTTGRRGRRAGRGRPSPARRARRGRRRRSPPGRRPRPGRSPRRRRPLPGPVPDGLHATSAQPVASGEARRARATDPEIRPKPRKAIRTGADRVARSVLPAGVVGRRGRRRPATAASMRAAIALPPLRLALGRAGVVRRVLAAEHLPALVVAPLVAQVGAAARTAPLLGEERLERGRGVDLPAAGPARKAWHLDLRQSGQRGLDLLSGYS